MWCGVVPSFWEAACPAWRRCGWACGVWFLNLDWSVPPVEAEVGFLGLPCNFPPPFGIQQWPGLSLGGIVAVYIFPKLFALVTLGRILPLREYSGDVLSARRAPPSYLVPEPVGLAGRTTALAAWASSAGLLCRKPTEEAPPI